MYKYRLKIFGIILRLSVVVLIILFRLDCSSSNLIHDIDSLQAVAERSQVNDDVRWHF